MSSALDCYTEYKMKVMLAADFNIDSDEEVLQEFYLNIVLKI